MAEIASKHGIDPTMMTWNKQAVDGLGGTFSGTTEAAKAAGEADIEKLHGKIGQIVVERVFCRKGSYGERG